jgi:hypothetical protein
MSRGTLSSVIVSRTTLGRVGLSRIALRRMTMSSMALGRITLRMVTLSRLVLSTVTLGRVALSSVPLRRVSLVGTTGSRLVARRATTGVSSSTVKLLLGRREINQTISSHKLFVRSVTHRRRAYDDGRTEGGDDSRSQLNWPGWVSGSQHGEARDGRLDALVSIPLRTIISIPRASGCRIGSRRGIV